MSAPAEIKFFKSTTTLMQVLEGRKTEPQKTFVVSDHETDILGIQTTHWDAIPAPFPKNIHSIVVIEKDPEDQIQTRKLLPLRRALFVVRPSQHRVRPPVVLISPPRAGSHLLIRLVEELGYMPGGKLGDSPKNGRWYNLMEASIHSSSHKYFYRPNQTGTHHGGQFSTFDQCLCIAMFRHPITIAVSRLNYNFNRNNTIMGRMLSSESREKKLQALLEPTHVFGDYGAELADFVNWLDFPNVYPIGFEELAGSDTEIAESLISDIMLLLSIDGVPQKIRKSIIGSSPTFYQGLVQYQDNDIAKVTKEITQRAARYMEKVGYTADSFFPEKLKYVRENQVSLDYHLTEDERSIKVLETKNFIIARYKGMYQIAHKHIPLPQFIIDIRIDELCEAKWIVEELEKTILLSEPRIQEALKYISKLSSYPPQRLDLTPPPPLLVASLSLGNIVMYQHLYFFVPLSSGEVELDKIDHVNLPPGITYFTTKVEALLYGNSILSSPFVDDLRVEGSVMGHIVGTYEKRFWNVEEGAEPSIKALSQELRPEDLENTSMTQHDTLIDLIDYLARKFHHHEKILAIANKNYEVHWEYGFYKLYLKEDAEEQHAAPKHWLEANLSDLKEIVFWLLDTDSTMEFKCFSG